MNSGLMFGIPCKVSPYLPAGTMMALGAHGETPNNWAEMTDWEKMDWCIAHDAEVFISPDVHQRLRKERDDYDRQRT